MSNQGIDKVKIAAPLHGIESLDSPIRCPTRIEDKIWKPPSYIVRLALSIAGFRVGWPDEKVTWSSFMRFKGIGFEVRDWKRSTWTIEADRGDSGAFVVAAELKKKILAACSILNKQLAVLRQPEIENGKFFLDNTYLKIRNVYEHFREKMLEAQTPLAAEAKFDETIRAHIDYQRHRTFYGCAAVAFYFSCMETILDIAYALGDQSIGYFAFKNLKWRERVCHVLPVGDNAELNKLHSRLLRLKSQVRDRVLHGLGGVESILLPTPGLGLLPLSYEHVDSMNMFAWVPFSEEALEDVPAVFDEFDAWLAKHPPWSDYVLLAKSMIPIPLFGKRRQEIMDALGDNFEDWMHSEQEHEDYVLNHWD